MAFSMTRVQDLLDLELAVRLQVGAAAAPFADDAALGVGEIAHGFRASGIDAEHIHGYSLCYISVFVMAAPHCPSRVALCLRVVAVALALVIALATPKLATFVAASEGRVPSKEVRALWVTRATLSSPAAIAQMVRAAQNGGFNTLIVQVRGRGDAYYTSALAPRASELASRPDFDPLAETIAVAARAGLRVHAWIVVNLVSSAVELPASREHVVYRQPDWLMVPRELAAEMLATDPRSPQYVGRLARWTRARAERRRRAVHVARPSGRLEAPRGCGRRAGRAVCGGRRAPGLRALPERGLRLQPHGAAAVQAGRPPGTVRVGPGGR